MTDLALRRGRRVIALDWGLGDLPTAPPGWVGPWPPVPTNFPNPTNALQQAAQNQLAAQEQGLQQNATALFDQLASTAGVSSSDWQQQTSALIQTYGANVMRVANDALSGNFGIQDVQVLVGAVLTATGAGAVVGVAVAAGLSVLQSLMSVLSPGPCANCSGRCIGNTCISGTTLSGKPIGPSLPSGTSDPNWLTWQDALDMSNGKPDFILPHYSTTIACELKTLDPSDPMQAFFITYYQALMHAAEYTLNGYQAPTPWDIFAQTQTTWNASHGAPNVPLTAETSVNMAGLDMPGPSSGGCVSQGGANQPGSVSYIAALLGGAIDGKSHLTDANGTGQIPGGINTGPLMLPAASSGGGGPPVVHLPTPTSPGGSSSSMSTGSKVAVGAAAVGALGAGGLYAYAHYNGLTMAQALKSLRFWK